MSSDVRPPSGDSKTVFHAAGPKNKIPEQQQRLAENVGDAADRVLSGKKHARHKAPSLENRVEDKTQSG